MSGSSNAPTSQVIQQTTVPEYARRYVEGVLDTGSRLTSEEYTPYPGERAAQFTPLQQQAFAGARGLGPAAQLGQAGAMFQQAGAGLGGYATQAAQAGQGFAPGTFTGGMFGQPEAQQYMSPYMQSVVDIQKREAARDAAIAGTQQQAQATAAGAFGGSRDALMRAERERNLMQQQGDIQSRGLQSAFEQAQAQFNADQARRMQAQQLGEQSRQFGAGLGLQGLEAAMRGQQGMFGAAQGLAGLGAEQFRQQAGALDVQSRAGALQQQQVQNILDQRYRDFQAEQQFPYQQLAFMSDLLRGGYPGQTATQMYQAPPSPFAQLAGAGLSAYALGRAAGGPIPGAGLADAALARMRG